MAELRWSTPEGELRVHGWQRPVMEAALVEGQVLAREGRTLGEFREFVGQEVYLKAGPLGPSARRRHGLRYRLTRRPWPRVQEYENLSWLLERHFQALLPLAAGVLLRRGWPVYQFLATARQRDAKPFEALFPTADPEKRHALIRELAREVARMHALRFLHGDLYPRNLLVLPPTAPRRLIFLDAWAGGLAPQRRGAGYDLACFFLEGCELLDEDEQRLLLESYAQARRVQGRPVGRGWLRSIERARRGLWKQLRREPKRLRGRDLPREAWSAPGKGR